MSDYLLFWIMFVITLQTGKNIRIISVMINCVTFAAVNLYFLLSMCNNK